MLAQSPDIVVSVLEEMPDHHQELHPHLEIESGECLRWSLKAKKIKYGKAIGTFQPKGRRKAMTGDVDLLLLLYLFLGLDHTIQCSGLLALASRLDHSLI